MTKHKDLLAVELGESLAKMTQLSQGGDRDGAVKQMEESFEKLHALREVAGMERLSEDSVSIMRTSFLTTIERNVRAAKAAV